MNDKSGITFTKTGDFVAVPFRASPHRAARRCHAKARRYENQSQRSRQGRRRYFTAVLSCVSLGSVLKISGCVGFIFVSAVAIETFTGTATFAGGRQAVALQAWNFTTSGNVISPSGASDWAWKRSQMVALPL